MINICACMGPLNGEPFCPCVMINEGLSKPDAYALLSSLGYILLSYESARIKYLKQLREIKWHN